MFYDGNCPCIIVGDFNARIGNLQDFNDSFDDLKKRTGIDNIKKNHDPFMNFLSDSKFCVLNGRFDKSKDNYTSISSKGCAVVDYMCVPYDLLQYITCFSVLTMKDVMSTIDYQSSTMSALPDHSILTCNVNFSPYSQYSSNNKCMQAEPKGTFCSNINQKIRFQKDIKWIM